MLCGFALESVRFPDHQPFCCTSVVPPVVPEKRRKPPQTLPCCTLHPFSAPGGGENYFGRRHSTLDTRHALGRPGRLGTANGTARKSKSPMFMRLGTVGRLIYPEGAPHSSPTLSITLSIASFHFVAHFARRADFQRFSVSVLRICLCDPDQTGLNRTKPDPQFTVRGCLHQSVTPTNGQ
jgi:hypothetical protein